MSDYEQGQVDLIQHIKDECMLIVENSDKDSMSTDILIMLMNLKPKDNNGE